MFCIKCGKTLDSSARVCPDCGTKVVLPEGFVPDEEDTMNIDLLTGEKTVAADHEALARKAAAASAKPEEPKFSTGFDLNSAKKIMNGRSILIDDSPAPSATPVFTAAPAPVQNPQNNNKPDSKKYIIIIVAAVAVIAVALAAIFIVINSKKDNEENNENSSDIATVETTVGETHPSFPNDKEEIFTERFEENTTLGNISQEITTDAFESLFPTSDDSDNKGNKVDKDNDDYAILDNEEKVTNILEAPENDSEIPDNFVPSNNPQTPDSSFDTADNANP